MRKGSTFQIVWESINTLHRNATAGRSLRGWSKGVSLIRQSASILYIGFDQKSMDFWLTSIFGFLNEQAISLAANFWMIWTVISENDSVGSNVYSILTNYQPRMESVGLFGCFVFSFYWTLELLWLEIVRGRVTFQTPLVFFPGFEEGCYATA